MQLHVSFSSLGAEQWTVGLRSSRQHIFWHQAKQSKEKRKIRANGWDFVFMSSHIRRVFVSPSKAFQSNSFRALVNKRILLQLRFRLNEFLAFLASGRQTFFFVSLRLKFVIELKFSLWCLTSLPGNVSHALFSRQLSGIKRAGNDTSKGSAEFKLKSLLFNQRWYYI